ncbi:hypothetical protein [Desulfosudis oleivorans]|uniref:Uncharacterized protein n=1 Tax=Desulfosudis oleivorans (strain DSM 6200 / JCM 39069 / Hxd3) TaxID=96561 RepID=A8ZXE7_DESOH|nr:hypothetical protein [Desulfosudis oleivorans]ABW68526.1 hypothetical protein Dole_2723 [Desulfosudis oleivorans Hxd3]
MSEEKQVHTADEEEKGFDKFIIKVLGFLKLTSGTGLIGLGGFWFLYGILQFLFVGAENVMQQQVQETFFLQAEMGLLIVGVGILIREIKQLKK